MRVLAVAAGVTLAGISCSRDSTPLSTVTEFAERGDLSVSHATALPVLLDLQTYDGSGQTVHPDFVSPGPAWGQRVSYLVLTPYPNGKTKNENPSLYADVDGVAWGAAPRAPMPLARPTKGYLSDPDIVHDPDRNELFVYYREFSDADRIYLIRSRDGAAWSKPTLVLTGAKGGIISPAVVRRASGDWLMWSVNGAPGCHGRSTTVDVRRSTDGLVWSDPQPVMLPLQPDRFAWHLDVQWIRERNEYWALFPVKAPRTCVTTALFLATSPDGVTWKVNPEPVLTAGVIPEFEDVVYRSTFAYTPATDEITFWFSGARVDGKQITWRSAVQSRFRSDVMAFGALRVESSVPVASDMLSRSFDPP